MLDLVVFYFFAALAVASAVLVVTLRNAVQSAIFLVTALLATAGIFLSLNAQFLFIVQIILYAGGIMVLFVFVIMLVNLDVALHQVQFNRQWFVGLVLALVLGVQVIAAILVSRQRPVRRSQPVPAAALRIPIPSRSPRRCFIRTCWRLRSLRFCCWWPWWEQWSWPRKRSESWSRLDIICF